MDIIRRRTMIDNFNIISDLIDFGVTDTLFFHLQVIRRGKDHPGLPATNKVIQSWLVRSKEHLASLRDDVVFLCEHYKARAYINVAPKSMEKLNTLILCKMAENIHKHLVSNPWHTLNSAIGELQGEQKRWVVDIDNKDAEHDWSIIETIDELWAKAHPEGKDKPRTATWLIKRIVTLNGCHLITRPFNLQKFKEKFPKVDVHKNNPTILYIPNGL